MTRCYCPHCEEVMSYDPVARTYFCLDCEYAVVIPLRPRKRVTRRVRMVL